MTNNQLTEAELTETLDAATSGYQLTASAEANLRRVFAELQERRKAELDSKPVAWTDEEELRDANESGSGYLFGIGHDANKFADPRRQIMLYRHAQPAPAVTFYRDGIEASAKWIDQQREAYDSEHGWSVPDTGTFEFGNDAQREYSSTLEELAEGIRALHPNVGNSPVIPDGWVACSERLPDETQPVITVSDGGVVQRTVYQFCEGVWSDWYEQYDDVTADAFTHWMPLPAAPQEVKGE